MSTRLPNLIPPFRYAMVEEDLFRGGFPKPRNYRFLKRLRLKTILSLIPDKPTPELQDFCERENIHMLRLTVDRMKEDNIPLSYNKTILALQIIIDPENHPLYVHCLDGADVTGLVIACLRKLQMWSLSSALLEFSRNLHTSVVTSEESEFVENFKNFEVTIPVSIRRWLWGGKINFRKHATLRLKFLNPEMMTDEERELKDKEERREKDKEDFYKKRKNDLLDNLFDSSTLTSSRNHRTNSVYASNQSSSNNNNSSNSSNNSNNAMGVAGGGSGTKGQGTGISSGGGGGGGGGGSTIGSHSNSTAGSGATNSKAGSPSMMSDDFEFSSSPKVMVTGMEDSNDDDIDHTNDNEQGEEDDDDDDDVDLDEDVGEDDKENDHGNEDGGGNGSGGGDSNSAKEKRRRHRSDKNQYLVDVDVDVENVMMDGLDQVQYYNRSSSYFGNDASSFYIGENNDNMMMMPDDLGAMYEEGPASRYTMEPISRTLEALALEGLD